MFTAIFLCNLDSQNQSDAYTLFWRQSLLYYVDNTLDICLFELFLEFA